MKATALTQYSIQSKLILVAASVVAVAAISSAFSNAAVQVPSATTSIDDNEFSVQRVEVVGTRMTESEKIAYDQTLIPGQIATIEIKGKRLNHQERLAMTLEEEMSSNHGATHIRELI